MYAFVQCNDAKNAELMINSIFADNIKRHLFIPQRVLDVLGPNRMVVLGAMQKFVMRERTEPVYIPDGGTCPICKGVINSDGPVCVVCKNRRCSTCVCIFTKLPDALSRRNIAIPAQICSVCVRSTEFLGKFTELLK